MFFYPQTTYSSQPLLFNDSINYSNLKATSHPRFLSFIPHILKISLSSDTPVPLKLVLHQAISLLLSLGRLVACIIWEQLDILTPCLSRHPCSCHSSLWLSHPHRWFILSLSWPSHPQEPFSPVTSASHFRAHLWHFMSLWPELWALSGALTLKFFGPHVFFTG